MEHRKQRLKSKKGFIIRMFRYAIFAVLLVTISIGIGVFGYMNLGNLGFIDSFYMACMILTGMGPIAEMKTNLAKTFSAFYALYSGVAFLSITAIFFAPIIHRILHILSVDED